jgi:hypothetical protein
MAAAPCLKWIGISLWGIVAAWSDGVGSLRFQSRRTVEAGQPAMQRRLSEARENCPDVFQACARRVELERRGVGRVESSVDQSEQCFSGKL